MKKIVIGVTGGIASGKSEICRILEQQGFLIIDADRLGHTVLEETSVIDRIQAEFGEEVVETISGQKRVDRAALGKIVFADQDRMKCLEKITHPAIVTMIRKAISESELPVALEAIALFRSGVSELCDFLWLVKTARNVQIERMVKNRGYSYTDAEARLKTQEASNDWAGETFDTIIDSSESIGIMRKKVLSFLEKCL